MNFLRQDYFSYTIARMLGPDYFKYFFPINAADRAAALEEALEDSTGRSKSTYPVPFSSLFSSFPAMNGNRVTLPLLFINTTRMQDGNPGVVTNLNISIDTSVKNAQPMFNRRVDVVSLLDSNKDFTIATASILGARFPYLSPAGAIRNNYFVDGGYFDNSGAGVVQELIRGILQVGSRDNALVTKIRKLNFKIIHVVNSPIIPGSSDMKKVAPIKNDLLSPVLTIVASYDMQTTVNDIRLINYIDDINGPGANHITASYTKISLYKDSTEWANDFVLGKRFDKEPGYAMNWFMSDSTAKRIDARLRENHKLDSLVKARVF